MDLDILNFFFYVLLYFTGIIVQMSVLLFYQLSFLCLYKRHVHTDLYQLVLLLLVCGDSLAYEVSVRSKTCKHVKLFTSLAYEMGVLKLL